MVAVFWHNGTWFDEQPKVLGPMDHAMWMASVVFDGARIFNCAGPDIDLHCERLVDSAKKLCLKPPLAADEIHGLVEDAAKRLPKDKAYYVRPMCFAMTGFVAPDPESTEFLLAVYETPMPEPSGFSMTVSTYTRPSRHAAPVDAKASCNYPNGQRALLEARRLGFDNCLILDANGNVAELATANIWMVKDGVAYTPAWTGTFLNGVTKQRIASLLIADGYDVIETALTVDDFRAADEIFSSGNYGKVMPVRRFDDLDLQPGPVFARARELYFDYAAGCPIG